jgi:Methylamine utilisation protein MauE
MSMPIDPTVGTVLVLGYAALLLPAAWHKIRDRAVFAAVLEAYRILPRRAVPWLAPFVPLTEATLAAGLCVTAARPVCAVGVALLLGLYAAAIAWNLVRGRTDLDCGCTGPRERRPVAAWMVYRNALLAGLVLPIAGPWSNRSLTALDVFAVVAALLTAILLWLAIDRLLGQVVPRGALLKVSR